MASKKRKREDDLPERVKRLAIDMEQVSPDSGGKGVEEAAQLNSLLHGEASAYYRFPPSGKKEVYQLIKSASWRALVGMAPQSNVWKLKKAYYARKKRAREAKFRSKIRSYVKVRCTKKPMAGSRFRSGFRYGRRSFGFRRGRSYR